MRLLLAALILLASATPAAAQTWRVAPGIDLGDEARPSAVAVGDFDSDGKQDLAVADFAGRAVHVRLGNGDGTFRGTFKVPNVVMAEDVAVGDLDADGHEDLVIGALAGAELQLAPGKGDGTFVVHTNTHLPGKVHAIALGELDNDARTDLVLAAGDHLSVLLKYPSVSEFHLPTGSPVPSVAAGDFDGNGFEDVALVLTGEAPRLALLPSQGDGTFGLPAFVPLASRGAGLAVGNLDGDAREDVVVALPGRDRVLVRLGTGQAPEVAVGGRPAAVALGDVDGDGREDLVTADEAGTASVRLGNGDGTFHDGGELSGARKPVDVAIGDFDADGRADLAIADHDGGSVAVRLGAGAVPLDGNRLVNGGFEQGLGGRTHQESPLIPGWTTAGGMTFLRYGIAPHFGVPTWLDAARFGGGRHFLWGGDSTGHAGVTEASQTVAVTDVAEAIDAGRASATLSAQLGGALTFPDTMTATAEFLDADGAALGVLRAGPVTPTDRANVTAVLGRAGTAALPPRTRRIRVTLTSRDTDRYSSAIADNVKLTIATQPAPVPSPPAFGAATRVTIALAARRAPLRVRVANANGFAVTGRLSGRRFTVAAGGRTTVRPPLRRAQRRRLLRKGRLALRLAAVVADPAGNRRTVTRRVTLRRR